MKLQIDTDNKTITIEGSILLKDLMVELNRFFPNETWKAFTLKIERLDIWVNPITPVYSYPWITTIGTGTFNDLAPARMLYNSGIYNIELK